MVTLSRIQKWGRLFNCRVTKEQRFANLWSPNWDCKRRTLKFMGFKFKAYAESLTRCSLSFLVLLSYIKRNCLVIKVQVHIYTIIYNITSHLLLFLFLLLPPRAYIQRYKNKWYVACSFSKEMSVQFWAQWRKAKSRVNYHGVGRFESVEIMESQAYEK